MYRHYSPVPHAASPMMYRTSPSVTTGGTPRLHRPEFFVGAETEDDLLGHDSTAQPVLRFRDQEEPRLYNEIVSSGSRHGIEKLSQLGAAITRTELILKNKEDEMADVIAAANRQLGIIDEIKQTSLATAKETQQALSDMVDDRRPEKLTVEYLNMSSSQKGDQYWQ